jgi:plastocyanin
MKTKLSLCCIPVAIFFGLIPVEGAEVTGRVRIIGRAPSASVETVVYAERLDAATPVRPGSYAITQRNRTFVPSVVAVPLGSKIEFPNADMIFHNVFSLSRPDPFDLGLYRGGASRSRVFSQAGTFLLFCNIHPDMSAVILVLPTSHIASTNQQGNYKLDLPVGRYRLVAWSPRSEKVSAEISVSAGTQTVNEMVLDESKFVAMPHRNKFGQDYPKSGYDPLKSRKP